MDKSRAVFAYIDTFGRPPCLVVLVLIILLFRLAHFLFPTRFVDAARQGKSAVQYCCTPSSRPRCPAPVLRPKTHHMWRLCKILSIFLSLSPSSLSLQRSTTGRLFSPNTRYVSYPLVLLCFVHTSRYSGIADTRAK